MMSTHDRRIGTITAAYRDLLARAAITEYSTPSAHLWPHLQLGFGAHHVIELAAQAIEDGTSMRARIQLDDGETRDQQWVPWLIFASPAVGITLQLADPADIPDTGDSE